MGKVKRANSLLKDQLTKLSLEVKLSWPDLLPIALARLHAAPWGLAELSAFELMYGRPFLLNTGLPTTSPPLASYLPYFTLLRHLLREHADQLLPQPTSSNNPGDVVILQPGDQVLLRELQPGLLQPCWTEPYTVILTTPTAAKLLRHPAWYPTKRGPPPDDVWQTELDGPLRIQL